VNTTPNQLTDLEQRVLEAAFAGRDAHWALLRQQAQVAVVKSRDINSVGSFTYLQVDNPAIRIAHRGLIGISDLTAVSPHLKNGASYAVLISDGYINSIEGCIFGDDVWPSGRENTIAILHVPVGHSSRDELYRNAFNRPDTPPKSGHRRR
jgi:hypothetical protein